jgi:nucleotide-binding universal stress UspA family protein
MIVVGVDHRPRARDAVALGRSLARALRDELLLVWVRPVERRPGRFMASFRMPALLQRRLEAEGTEARLQALAADTEAARPGALGCRFRTVTATSPAEGLARVAAEEQASLLVLGASERAGLGRVQPGSTATALLAGRSSVPVAVAPGHYLERLTAERVIAVGFGGGAEARVALAWADQLATRLEAALRVVAVVEPLALGEIGADPLPTESVSQSLRHHLRAEAERAIGTCCQSANVDIVLRDGDPAAELADISETVDLLVLGSRGRGPARSVLLGSVSQAVFSAARAPVIVVPRSHEIDSRRLEDLSLPAASAVASH